MSIDTLVELARDRAVEHGPFGARTTYRVGGTARLVLEIDSPVLLSEWSESIRNCELPVVVLGNGSNVLVADEEFAGIVVLLGRGFETLSWRDDGDDVVVDVGAAMDLPVVARRLSENAVASFEWAVGVPGTIGGAAFMNAGGHGSDMAHCVSSVATWSLERARHETWTLNDLAYGYRRSSLGPMDVVTAVTLTLRHGSSELSRASLREIVRWRREHQPGGANAGSVFRNPQAAAAGALIEAAGLKGHRIGSAQVSEKHANFIQVDNNGRAHDVLDLMIYVRDVVKQNSGVTLESELRTIGFAERWP